MNPSRVLVAVDDCGPGDALLINFCLVALRKAMPGARIDCLASTQAAPVLELTGIFDRVIVSSIYERRAGSGSRLAWHKLASSLRMAAALAFRYDLAVTFYWGSTLLNLLTWFAAPARSVAHSNHLGWIVRGGLGRYAPDGDPVEQAAAVMAVLGIAATPMVAAPLHSLSDAPGHPRDSKGIGGRRYAVVHVGSDWACQQWLPERWAELADRLAGRWGLLPVFTGVAEEDDQVERIRGEMRCESLSLAGDTTLVGLSGLLQEAELFVGVDSLAFELAQAAGVPSVVLAGQSRLAVSLPSARPVTVVNRTTADERAGILSCKLSVVKASYGGCRDFDCPMSGLRGVQVDDVLRAVSGVCGAPAPAVR